MNETLSYYNTNISSFIESTQSVQMTEAWDKFTSKLPLGSLILDFGCGSGRDTKYFLEHDFNRRKAGSLFLIYGGSHEKNCQYDFFTLNLSCSYILCRLCSVDYF